MIVCCYYSPVVGGHPHCTPSEYDQIWPVMQRSVEAQGYELVHLTTRDAEAKCAKVFRYDGDPNLVMWTRELAWLEFLRSVPDDEQVVMVEPDCMLLRQVPRLHNNADLMLLRRYKGTVPAGFRLARKSAIPFYEAVVAEYSTYPEEHKKFHGDAGALLAVAKRPGWNIEWRSWLLYTSKLWRDAVAWNFKGTSKITMLEIAKGAKPQLR